jgi:hypothetical protein
MIYLNFPEKVMLTPVFRGMAKANQEDNYAYQN